MSTPSYSFWATDIVRFGLNASLRLASCWSVEVVNGGAGLRDCLRVATFVTSGFSVRSIAAWTSAVSPSPIGSPLSPIRIGLPSIRTTSAAKRLAVDRREDRLERPVLRAVNASISRSRSTTSRTATDWTRPADRPDRTFRRQQRAQRVADEPVDDPAGLLGVDEVRVDVRADGRTRRGSRPR